MEVVLLPFAANAACLVPAYRFGREVKEITAFSYPSETRCPRHVVRVMAAALSALCSRSSIGACVV